jgi:cellulose synthase/poly-beta-1,6-N-acetylglucosamine synthase-like glycosyltransferase
MAAIILALSLGALLYVYVGYPVLLQMLVWVRGARPVRRGTHLPRVTLIVSAYNEAGVIGRKLQNALSLDYPADLFEIVVVSDCSTDGTDEIVQAVPDSRVLLARQPERRGKTAGLNRTVPHVAGDIVVFSDANAMYEPDSIRKLVRNFADPQVGCVTGEARYLEGDQSTADVSERAYWNYEIWIKRMETAVGSMVGGDGAIYAIRRGLWQSLPENAINDFLNPLQIVAAGWRGVYEPEAVCYEETAAGVQREWRRRVRIVSRSWRAVFQAPGVLNPFRVGLFSFSLVSHKILRWFSGFFLGLAFAAGVLLVTRWEGAGRLRPSAIAAILVTLLVFAALSPTRGLPGFLFYFVAINAASFIGVLKGTAGRVSGVWTTPRADSPPALARHLGIAVMTVAIIGMVAAVVLLIRGGAQYAPAVFWSAVGILAYVYGLYPIILRGLSTMVRRPVARGDVEPRVCLVIAAHNEAAVMREKLENSLALDYPPDLLQVVVASDGSDDGTNDIVRPFGPRVTLLDSRERRGKMAVINHAMREAVDAEVVVFSDANTFLRRDAVRCLVRNFADPAVGAVSGDVALTGQRAELAASEDLYYKYERYLQRAESDVGSLVGVDGALYAIRASLFTPPPDDTILDDMAIPMAVLRSGRRVVFEPAALGEEAGSSSAAEEFWRKVRVVAGAVQFLVRRDSEVPVHNLQALFTLLSHKALRWMSPAFALLAVAAAALAASASPLFALVLAAQAVLLMLGIAGCIPRLRRLQPVALAHYLCLVQTAAALGFVRGLLGRQTVLWRRFERIPRKVVYTNE